MKRVFGALGALLLSTGLALAGGSTINTAVPAPSAPLQSAPVRNNFVAAATDINNLMSMFAGTSAPSLPVTFQMWANPGVNPAPLNIYDGTQFVLVGSLDRITHQYSPALGASSVVGAAPITSTFAGTTATIGITLDSNFAVVGSALALNPVSSGQLLANCTGSLAEPTGCNWNAFANQAISSTNGVLPYRISGSWGTIAAASSATASTLSLRDSLANVSANNFLFNFTSTSSIGGTTVLTNASSRYQILTGSQVQTYQLPDATTLAVGWTFEFNNSSTNVMTIVNNGSGAVTTVPPGGYARLDPTSVATANGVWDVHFIAPSGTAWGSAGLALIGNGTSAFAVGPNGATNPVFQVDASTASQAAGLKITGAVTAGVVAVSAIDSSPNTNLSIDAKGSGQIVIQGVSTGGVTIVQPLSLRTGTIPSPDAGTLLQGASAGGTISRAELTAAAQYSAFTGRRADGTFASPTTLVSSDLISTFNAHGYDGTAWSDVAGAFRLYAEGTWSGTSHPTEGCISTTPVSSTTIADVFCVHNSGGVSVGTGGGAGDPGLGNLNLSGGSLLNAGVVPTGTGAYVRATSPALVTPSLGAATATSINGVTITSTTGTLTVANGKTLTVNNSLTLAGTDLTTMTFPTTSATIARTDSAQTFSGNQSFNNAILGTTENLTTTSASGFNIGPNGATNPAFSVDSSAASMVAGIVVKGAATGQVVSITATDSGANTNLAINPKGTGFVSINGLIHTASAGTLSIANNASAQLITSGNFALTLTSTATTNSTFPAGTHTLAALDLADQTVSGGANYTAFSIGTVSSGTTTIDCGKNPVQFLTNGGAFTLAAPANDGSCIVLSTNNASAGTITFSGFSVGASTGDPLTTANASKFSISIWRINGVSGYRVAAMQ